MHLYLYKSILPIVLLLSPFLVRAQASIAFRSDRSGSPRIHIMDMDGQNMRILEHGAIDDPHADTTTSYAAAGPQWSPDGKKLVFYTYWGAEKNRTDGQDIVVINADGTDRKRLTQDGYNTDPAWSPDGEKIVFRSLQDGKWGLFIVDITTNETKLLINTLYMDRAPHWSPDGDKIVFSSGYGSDRPTGEDIFSINVDGTQLTQLTQRQGEESMPQWSPDGSSIVYNEGTDSTAQIVQMDPNGKNKKVLTLEGINYSAAFSNDGNTIVYTSSLQGNSEVFSLSLDDGQITQLTDHPSRDNSPDYFIPLSKGKIAFQRRLDDHDEIYIMNSDGSEIQNLTNHPAEDRRPWWSPKGDKIYFETNRNGNWDIYIMDSDGSNPSPVFESDTDDKYPGLSSDGQYLAFMGKNLNLYKLSTDIGKKIALTQDNDLNSKKYYHYPTWSPDNKMICFSSNMDTGIPPDRNGEDGLEIYLMNSDGTNLRRLTFNKKEDSLPVFSPDGKHIIFNSSRTGNYHLYIMRIDGRELSPLTWGRT